MTSLRDVLAAGEADTPAGVDLGAVRSRAGRIRRRRVTAAVGTAAALAAVATAVPVLALRPDATPTAAPTAAPAPDPACPDVIPPASAGTGTGALLPGAPTGALVCGYEDREGSEGPRRLIAVLPLTPAETRDLADRLEASATPPDGPVACTAEGGVPFAVRFVDADRATTVRIEPMGCAVVTNGSVSRLATTEKGFLAGLGRRAAGTSTCPQRLADPGAVLTGPAGATLLPADTRRLRLCAYADGVRTPRDPRWPADDRVLEDPGGYVAGLNAAAPAADSCAPLDRGPVLLVAAVTPTGVKRVVARPGDCPSATDGTRTVAGGILVQDLYALTRS